MLQCNSEFGAIAITPMTQCDCKHTSVLAITPTYWCNCELRNAITNYNTGLQNLLHFLTKQSIQYIFLKNITTTFISFTTCHRICWVFPLLDA